MHHNIHCQRVHARQSRGWNRHTSSACTVNRPASPDNGALANVALRWVLPNRSSWSSCSAGPEYV